MPSIFSASVIAVDAADALSRVAKRLAALPGFSLTGDVAVRSAKHKLWMVDIAADGSGDPDDAWVTLTSYGISPDDRLGSRWAKVRGLGR